MWKCDNLSAAVPTDLVKTQRFLRRPKYQDFGKSVRARYNHRMGRMAHSYSPVTPLSSVMAYSA